MPRPGGNPHPERQRSSLTRPRGEGPPGARAGPTGNPPLPRQALCWVPPRRQGLKPPCTRTKQPPLPRSESRPGDFPGIAATSGDKGCASLSGGRPRGAYLGAGAADRPGCSPRPLQPPVLGAGLSLAACARCAGRSGLVPELLSLAPNPPPPTLPPRPLRFARPLAVRGAPASRPPLAASSCGRRRRLLFAPLSGCPPAAPPPFLPPLFSSGSFSDCWRETSPPP